jgi:hypothetical protein
VGLGGKKTPGKGNKSEGWKVIRCWLSEKAENKNAD